MVLANNSHTIRQSVCHTRCRLEALPISSVPSPADGGLRRPDGVLVARCDQRELLIEVVQSATLVASGVGVRRHPWWLTMVCIVCTMGPFSIDNHRIGIVRTRMSGNRSWASSLDHRMHCTSFRVSYWHPVVRRGDHQVVLVEVRLWWIHLSDL